MRALPERGEHLFDRKVREEDRDRVIRAARRLADANPDGFAAAIAAIDELDAL